MDSAMPVDIVLSALRMAEKSRHNRHVKTIGHSNQGGQYSAVRLQNYLNKSGFIQSMSGAGNCYENAKAESFFSALKHKLLCRYQLQTRAGEKSLYSNTIRPITIIKESILRSITKR